MTETQMLEVLLEYVPDQDDELDMGEMLDRIFQEMLALGISDPHVVANSRDREVFVSIYLDEDVADPVWKGLTDIRTAIHASGASTPNWPTLKFKGMTSGKSEDGTQQGLVPA